MIAKVIKNQGLKVGFTHMTISCFLMQETVEKGNVTDTLRP
jgi:hypothetical protein